MVKEIQEAERHLADQGYCWPDWDEQAVRDFAFSHYEPKLAELVLSMASTFDDYVEGHLSLKDWVAAYSDEIFAEPPSSVFDSLYDVWVSKKNSFLGQAFLNPIVQTVLDIFWQNFNLIRDEWSRCDFNVASHQQ